MRVTVTPVVYPRVFEFLTTLTFRALHGNHILTVTPVVYPRLFSHQFDTHHVAHRQPEAEPEEPEEQGIDVLQVIFDPQLSRRIIQSAGYFERVMATTTNYPRLFEISITLTFRAGYLQRIIDTATVDSRWFEFPTTLTFNARTDTWLP